MAVIVVVGIAMPGFWRQREKLQERAFNLPVKLFLENEQARLTALMRLESRISWLLATAIAGLGVCFAPPITSVRQKSTYWSVILVLVVAIASCGRQRTRDLEAERYDRVEQLEDLLRDAE